MKIVIASDHAGFIYKNIILKELQDKGVDITDLGVYDTTPADYPDCAESVATAISSGKAERGILICGSGVGVSVAVNKFKGIRGGVCHDTYSAHQCVEHDDANVLCIGERVIGIEPAREIVAAFLDAKFTHEARHQRRLDKINAIEEKNMK
ncbi:ribose 5-phosphate isomerase B [Ferruginibacter sp. HRS2-29]|uniref:ribose 5-phosphate isomerase B n=1 Tax=Ferruginibacter sp. HRS2-29 TaxID=2487334 RepID=UPI0020CF1871|nr:ribose 5-phosphate isomerase B [Ferruginibacter sp. HRS2-29]MCP9749421.1 ribose 5-phosphate isomerase B [Ferruginibacter sp. HRS2-29]